MDVGDLAAGWLAFKGDEVGASTLYTYERILRTRVLPALADIPMTSVKPLDLQRILMSALSERSSNEALKTRAVLRGMFGYAHQLGLVAAAPPLPSASPGGQAPTGCRPAKSPPPPMLDQ